MIESIKDLEKLLKLCRKQGVTDLTTSEVSFKLGDLPQRYSNTESIEEQSEELDIFNEPLTNEEMVQFANGVGN